eukprot:TRINITY_DN6271_c0_g1_i2.p1 TRINITY_DN6271_c0_g1~~TRINITY_DN6271_c0_g1_i2.p1  ORF type:complete len:206 (+),score=32.70 TRINITY_DN6271_c0_g1_i2:39-620(+)
MYLVALVAAVAIVKAQIPAHCHTPAEWEGRTSTWDHGANRHDTGRVVYDASNERVRFIDDINTFAPGRRAYEHLVLYRENIQYRVDLTSRECQKGPIDKRHAWHAFGIPVNATFQGERNIGALDETITASEWSVPAYDHPQGWEWYGSFSTGHCVPISEVVAYNVSDAISRHFYDITIGISDPNAFIPPEVCN